MFGKSTTIGTTSHENGKSTLVTCEVVRESEATEALRSGSEWVGRIEGCRAGTMIADPDGSVRLLPEMFRQNGHIGNWTRRDYWVRFEGRLWHGRAKPGDLTVRFKPVPSNMPK